jgi:HAD superfamily hydrolase (TIGR01490 family)
MMRRMDGGDRGTALFDLDGTLLAWDTQVLFCGHVLRREGWRRWSLGLFVSLLPLAPLLGAGGMKRVFLGYLWRATPAVIESWAREFANEWFPARCFPELLEEIAAHRRAGRRLILTSASPEFYVREVGRVLGFDHALGTVVGCGPRMRLFPALVNHKGKEKVRRLRDLLGQPDSGLPDSHGYSDSIADLPLLELCGQVTVVNPSSGLTKIARARGWAILQPAQPWSGWLGKAVAVLCQLLGCRQ